MNIEAVRLSVESRIISVRMFDKLINVLPTTLYKIICVYPNDALEHVVALVDIEVESSNYIITKTGDDLIIELMDRPLLYASDYIYRAIRLGVGDAIEDVTNLVATATLPYSVEHFRVVDEASTFDSTGTPRVINFQWDAYNSLTDNYNVIGFNVYYSVTERNKEAWSPWSKLRGNTTYNDSTYAINFIDKNATSIDINIPQLSDFNNPKDLKFAIVAITGGPSPLQSRFSNVELVSLKNKIIMPLTAFSGGTLILPIDSSGRPEDIDVLTLEVHVDFDPSSFEADTTVLMERLSYDANILGYDYKYTYEIRATEPLKSFATVGFYITLPSDAKYDVRVLNGSQWESTPCTYDTGSNILTFVLTSVGKFVLLVKSGSVKITPNKTLESLFNDATHKIISRLPSWFKMRSNPSKSNGAYFLDVIGLEMADIKMILDYAERQIHLGTADISQTDIIYKVRLPYDIDSTQEVAVAAPFYVLERTETLEEFLRPPYDGAVDPEIYYNNEYIVDFNDNVIYTRQMYNPTKDNPFGELEVVIFEEGSTEPSHQEVLPMEMHHVWNFFDEFGLLFNTPRLYGEVNAEYKERLFDVFKNKSNSSRVGLMNGIARELGIRINTVWQDNTKDLIIKEPMVIANMIKVDDKFVAVKDIWFTSEDYIVIKANTDVYPPGAIVTYVSGLEMHTFNNKKDEAFQQQLYNTNGTATKLFEHYVNTIKQRVPVEWGQFKWNEGYWDAGNASVGGHGYLPSIMDADIVGFRPMLIDLITMPKPISISIEETVQIERYDRRSAL